MLRFTKIYLKNFQKYIRENFMTLKNFGSLKTYLKSIQLNPIFNQKLKTYASSQNSNLFYFQKVNS